MSSVSCIALKQPNSAYDFKAAKSNSHGILNAVMWTVGSMLGSFSVQLSQNNTGILVSVTIINVLMMMMATLFLGKGLKQGNFLYIVPWIIVSAFSMYHIQLRDILHIYQVLLNMKPTSYLPWISLIAYALSLFVRFHLTLSVAYVAIQQWFNKKLEQEMAMKEEKK